MQAQCAAPPSRTATLIPINLKAAREEFFSTGCTKAPRFQYAEDLETVQRAFDSGSAVCMEYIDESRRVLSRAKEAIRGTSNVDEMISPEQLKTRVGDYIAAHGVEDRTEIAIDPNLSTPRVCQVLTGAVESYVVALPAKSLPSPQVAGTLDHELGTHLLRFRNDELQPWHGQRKNFELANPHMTEEGLATINQYLSSSSLLLYYEARHYLAACRASELGFVELFQELLPHSSNKESCWRLCCRAKQGLVDTSRPGALARGQAYFSGALSLLLNMQDIDVKSLYAGRVSWQDTFRLSGIAVTDGIALPHFLSTESKVAEYQVHCERMLAANML
mmetsp:Transcript_48161/g.112647  ORF Transcript_48161/g.112647 Transcript_48161/m.112647 type:complete len:333 (-) Transcript_48161:72-1070(-)